MTKYKEYTYTSFSKKLEANKYARDTLMPQHRYKGKRPNLKKVMCYSSFKIKKDVPTKSIIKKYNIKKIYPRYVILLKKTGKC